MKIGDVVTLRSGGGRMTIEKVEAKDWDIFAETELAALQLVTGMGWSMRPSYPTRDKHTREVEPIINSCHIPKLSKSIGPDGCAYSDGYCYVTPEGDVDVWVAADGGVRLGGITTPAQRTWLKGHGYRFSGGEWCRADPPRATHP